MDKQKRLTEFEHQVLVNLIAEYGIDAIRQRIEDIAADDTPIED
jgi:hypothetical protein